MRVIEIVVRSEPTMINVDSIVSVKEISRGNDETICHIHTTSGIFPVSKTLDEVRRLIIDSNTLGRI